MKQNRELEKKVDEVLRSLDGLSPAEPQPWFYARVMAKMSREGSTTWSRIGAFLSRPVMAAASVCLILGINVFFLVREPKHSKESRSVSQVETIESESIIASTSSYDFENLVQP